MVDKVRLRVDGDPIPQGSKTPIVINGKAVLIDGKGKGAVAHKKWRKKVREEAEAWQLANGHVPWNVPCKIVVKFTMPKPTKPMFDVPGTRPDLDKLIRSILDSISGKEGPIVIEDGRFCQIHAEKEFVRPGESTGVEFEVTPIYPVEQTLFE